MTIKEAIERLNNRYMVVSMCVNSDEARAENEALDMAIAALREQSAKDGWISVKDRLPDEEQDVLMLVEEIEVYGKHDERKHKWHNIFVGYCDDGNWLTSYCYGCEYISKVNDDFEARNDKSRVKVTRWMPLPEPPEQSKKNR